LQNPLLAPSALLLRQHTAGISEYELITLLKDQCDFIPETFAGDALSLFRTHFLLFNALYQLQEFWLNEGHGYLKIEALSIQFFPAGEQVSQVQALVAADSVELKAYYQNMQNLTETDRCDVESLLDNFWKKYVASDVRLNSLTVLELEDPVTMVDIRLAYRRKAMLLHPDRGGNGEELQLVNEAMEQLKNYYR